MGGEWEWVDEEMEAEAMRPWIGRDDNSEGESADEERETMDASKG